MPFPFIMLAGRCKMHACIPGCCWDRRRSSFTAPTHSILLSVPQLCSGIAYHPVRCALVRCKRHLGVHHRLTNRGDPFQFGDQPGGQLHARQRLQANCSAATALLKENTCFRIPVLYLIKNLLFFEFGSHTVTVGFPRSPTCHTLVF